MFLEIIIYHGQKSWEGADDVGVNGGDRNPQILLGAFLNEPRALSLPLLPTVARQTSPTPKPFF